MKGREISRLDRRESARVSLRALHARACARARLPAPGLLASALLSLGLLAGCANPVYKESQELAAAGRYDEALPRLAQLSKENPDQREYRATYFRQRELAVARAHAAADAARAAGQLDAAEEWYRKALSYDPDNARARAGLEESTALRRQAADVKRAADLLARGDAAGAESIARSVLAQNPLHPEARMLLSRIEDRRGNDAAPAAVGSPFQRPVTLEFRDAPIRGVFETMSRVAGVNFVFDKDVKPDTRITIFVRNTSIDEVMRLILTTNQLERKILNDSSVLIYPNLPAKAREYQDLVMRTFYLVNADVKQVQAMVRAISKTRDMFVDEKLNALIVRDTPEAMRLVEKLVASVDLAEPEVMLEIEVLEVSASRVQNLGIQVPTQIQYGVPNATGQVRYASPNGFVGTVANPVAIANFRADVSGANTLANPRIRVRNREKAKVHIGDKLPVFTTTATANVGVSASVNYLDVGLKLEIESNVYRDNEVAIKLALEVSSVTKEITGPSGSVAYQIGTRLANTVLRLRDGETQVLAGLISDEDRSSAGRIPGLGDLPVLGRLFGGQTDTHNKSEVVLLITPRVLRNLTPPDSALLAQYSGTDAQFGAAPLRLRMAGPGSLSLQTSGEGSMMNANLAPGAGGGTPGIAARPQDTIQSRREAIAARRAAGAAGIAAPTPGGSAATNPVPAVPTTPQAAPSPSAGAASSSYSPAVASAAGAAGGASLGGAARETEAPPQASADVALTIGLNGDARAGQEVEVLVGAANLQAGRALQVEVAFSTDSLEPAEGTVANSPGRVTVNLVGPGAQPLRFKATAAGGANANIAIVSARAADGSAAQILTPAPLAVAIKP